MPLCIKFVALSYWVMSFCCNFLNFSSYFLVYWQCKFFVFLFCGGQQQKLVHKTQTVKQMKKDKNKKNCFLNTLYLLNIEKQIEKQQNWQQNVIRMIVVGTGRQMAPVQFAATVASSAEISSKLLNWNFISVNVDGYVCVSVSECMCMGVYVCLLVL